MGYPLYPDERKDEWLAVAIAVILTALLSGGVYLFRKSVSQNKNKDIIKQSKTPENVIAWNDINVR